jgi:hypothetical protein
MYKMKFPSIGQQPTRKPRLIPPQKFFTGYLQSTKALVLIRTCLMVDYLAQKPILVAPIFSAPLPPEGDKPAIDGLKNFLISFLPVVKKLGPYFGSDGVSLSRVT